MHSRVLFGKHIIGRTVAAVATSAVIGGCQPRDGTTVPRSLSTPNLTKGIAITGSKIRRSGEDDFLAIAKREPEFAGYVFDRNHNLIVYVRDSSRFPSAGAAVSQQIATNHLDLPPWYSIGATLFRTADYTFQQLSDWRDSVTLRVLGKVHDVYSSDLDEALNRVTIGVDSSTARAVEATVLDMLGQLGIPSTAVHFSVGRQPRPAIGFSAARDLAHGTLFSDSLTLRDQFGTLAGGYEIRRNVSGGYIFCTAGLVLARSSTPYMVTASHCTSTMYGLDTGDHWYQVSGSSPIGTESWDTTGTYNGTYGAYARSSDAALIVDSMTSVRGAIARTLGRRYDTYGYIQIDTTRPLLYVYTTSSAPPVGTYVDKVGRSTGWTYGDVSGSCVDMYNPDENKVIYCTTKANVFTGKGDSGAALFAWDGADGADLYGLTLCLFEPAGTEEIDGDSVEYGDVSYFSGYTGFVSDLGSSSGLSATAGVTISSFTASGTISSSNPVVSWTAPTIGGTGSSSDSRYYLYRSTSAGEYNDPIASYYDATEYLDLDETVTGYNGTTRPPFHSSWIEYQVVAYNEGVTKSSAPIYFTQ